jgi:alpha/beta superfamily hydrolase
LKICTARNGSAPIELLKDQEGSKMQKLFITILLLCLQGCAVIIKESNIILHDDKLVALTQLQLEEINGFQPGIKAQALSLKRSDGTRASGLWIKQSGATNVVIYFSGNSMRINQVYDKLLPELLSLGTDLIWLDHRGVGGSEGKANLKNLLQDGLHTYNYVAANSNQEIIIHGLSLGSFIAGHIAVNRPVAALILEGSVTNAKDWVDQNMPWYSKPFISVTMDDNIAKAGNESVVKTYSGPLFILVGENDKTTPAALNQRLYDLSISKNKQIYIAKDRRHGNAITSPEAKSQLSKFIQAL